MSDASERISELIEKIRFYNTKYFEEQTSLIPDHEYDQLMNELKMLEADHPDLVRMDSPTQRIGESLSPNGKHIRHKEKMLSIENVYSEGELLNYADRIQKKIPGEKIEWICELKIDGIAASLIYEKGKLKLGLTRGDGVFGDDITDAVRSVGDIPQELPGAPDYLEVRGEIYMENTELVRINLVRAAAGEPAYANTRNLTAGTVKNTDPHLLAERKLRFFAHSVGSAKNLAVKNHLDFMEQLQTFGFHTSPFMRKADQFDDVILYCREIIPQLHELDFEIDGIVIKVNDFQQREKIGGTPKFPHWLIAYKFEKWEKQTMVNGITIQVGKSGTITPVAELEPVEIAGTIVSRSSLHNSEEIARKDVRVGDIVVVEKAGKIIPHIVRVEKHLRKTDLPPFEFPSVCPCCGTPVKKDESGVFIRCPNPDCIAQFREQLEYFASRNAMDIEGLGPAMVEQLTSKQKNGLFESEPLVNSFADLYRLTEKDILNLERKKDKSAKKLIAAIQKSKTKGPARLLNALSIRGIGEETSRLLIEKYRSFDALGNASSEELTAIPSIGEKLAASVYEYFHSEEGIKTIEDLKKKGLIMSLPESASETAEEALPKTMAGISICITGKLKHFARDVLKERIIKSGGHFASSVSSKTTCLLIGEGDEKSTKRTDAEKYKIPILTEDAFFEKYPELLQEEV
ncbi:MAG: NAD-dependent DNA ligase LigA [Planctomycetia bacterium]|nr:NAD-dependent DNA ligase LigA [Planctomycetia bacterium]